MLRDRPDFFMSDSQEPKRYRSKKKMRIGWLALEIFVRTAWDACETSVKCGQVVTRSVRVELKRKTIRRLIL